MLPSPETIEVQLLRSAGIRLVQDLLRAPGRQAECHPRKLIQVVAPVHLNTLTVGGALMACGPKRLEALLDIGYVWCRRQPLKGLGESLGSFVRCLGYSLIDALLNNRFGDLVDTIRAFTSSRQRLPEGPSNPPKASKSESVRAGPRCSRLLVWMSRSPMVTACQENTGVPAALPGATVNS